MAGAVAREGKAQDGIRTITISCLEAIADCRNGMCHNREIAPG